MSTPKSPTCIDTFLAKVPHTGEGGLEGLISELCSAASGQTFRLSISGSQQGQDSASEIGFGNRIKIETKRYGKSKLNGRGLLGEVTEATGLDQECDVWVLAATCPVSSQLEKKLYHELESRGCALLVLDKVKNGLSRIAVLVAMFPEQVLQWDEKNSRLLNPAQFRESVDVVRKQPGFHSVSTQVIEKLKGTLCGFGDARARVNSCLMEMFSAPGNMRRAFRQPIDVLGPSTRVIPRRSLLHSLNDWWNQSVDLPKHVVVLGEEGLGKTWAVMHWLTGFFQRGDSTIILPISAGMDASILREGGILEILSALLLRFVGLGHLPFWTKRVKRWLDEPRQMQPLFLLVIDGLNERSSLDWPKLFLELQSPCLSNHVAVLVTDRPAHWRPKCFRRGVDTFIEIVIERYSDQELDIALARHDISVSEVPLAIRELIRIPRYCDVVARHFHEILASGDLTKERVLFLEAGSRASRSGGISPDELNELFRDLARRWRLDGSIDRSTLRTVVSPFDSQGSLIAEIETGGVLLEEPGRLGHFRVERTRLVYGLGLWLKELASGWVERGYTRGQLDDELVAWFEPDPAMDLKVEVAGAALFHAYLQDGYPVAARRALLGYWLRQRNWSDSSQAAFVDYILRIPEDFVPELELLWASGEDYSAAEDLLANAFLRHRDAPSVRPIIIGAVERWLGLVHLAGFPLLRSSPEREQQSRTEIASRIGRTLPNGTAIIAGEAIVVSEEESLFRLRRLGLLIISAGNVHPFVNSIKRWAISSAVMGFAAEQDVVNWIIRLAPDSVALDLENAASGLLTQDKIAVKAGQILLRSLWRADSVVLKKRYPESPSVAVARFRADHESDPCLSGGAWTDSNCFQCMDRVDVPTRLIIQRIGNRLFDPKFPIPESLVHRVVASLNVAPSTYRGSLGQTIEEHDFEVAIPLLASRAPAALADIVRLVIRSITSRNEAGTYGLALWLPTVAILMGHTEIAAVRSRLDEIRKTLADPATGKNNAIMESYFFAALASVMSDAELVDDLMSRPSEALDRESLAVAFDGLDPVVARGLIARQDWEVSAASVIRTLWVLSSSAPRLNDKHRKKLLRHMNSTDPVVRGSLSLLAVRTDDVGLGQAIVSTGLTCKEEPRTFEDVWSARVITKFSNELSFEVAAGRLHVGQASYLLFNRGGLPDEVRVYAECLDRAWRSITKSDDDNDAALPFVRVPCDDSQSNWRLQFAQEPGDSVTVRAPHTVWGGLPPLRGQVLRLDSGSDQINEMERRRVEAVHSAWRTTSNNWFGIRFSRDAVRQILKYRSDLIEQWTSSALGGGAVAEKVRCRTASLLGAVCSVLLEVQPTSGRELWESLKQFGTGLSALPLDEYAFSVPDNAEVDSIRWSLLLGCANDEAIATLAGFARKHDRRGWLQSAIEAAVKSPQLETRARGLTLASFAEMSVEDFDGFVRAATLTNTWVAADSIGRLRERIELNSHARWWFKKFLESESIEESWGALQVSLRCADERMYGWRLEFVDDPRQEVQRRLRFFDLGENRLEKMFKGDKDRKNTLFGIKIEKGQHQRFMEV